MLKYVEQESSLVVDEFLERERFLVFFFLFYFFGYMLFVKLDVQLYKFLVEKINDVVKIIVVKVGIFYFVLLGGFSFIQFYRVIFKYFFKFLWRWIYIW